MIRNLIVLGTAASALASLTAADATAQVTTNAALKALAAGSAPFIQRAGYYAPGDGGNALYAWDAASTCTDDGGSCIVPNSAPTEGRWLLNQEGVVSVKAFGAVCNAAADDTASFNAALAARTSVFVPADATCVIAMHSSSDGLALNIGNHLYGQNQVTSIIQLNMYFTPSYDFVAGGRFNSIAVASNVGTVTTGWSHEMQAGQSITIGGSATSALNGTYTIQSVTAPDMFTITTSGVADGTYTDATSLIGPSGIGTSVIRAANRDDGNVNSYTAAEVDHLHFKLSTTVPLTLLDMTGMWESRIHDLSSESTSTGSGQIGIVCADRTPTNARKACFFNHVYDFVGTFGTVLHWSAYDGNAGINIFEGFNGASRIGIDATGTVNNSMHGLVAEWYIAGDSDTNSWDLYGVPANTTYIGDNFEGFVNSAGYNVRNFAWIPSTSSLFVNLPGVMASGPMAAPFLVATGTYNMTRSDSTILCDDVPATVNLPNPPAYSNVPGSGKIGEIVTFRAVGKPSWGKNSQCVIQGNSNTIEGNSSYTLNGDETVTLQWDVLENEWEIISLPPTQLPLYKVNQLPTCSAAQIGLMYAVSDATSPTYNGTLTGGGSTTTPVFCNGSAWTAH